MNKFFDSKTVFQIHTRPKWQLSESAVTSHAAYLSRRQFLGNLSAGIAGSAALGLSIGSSSSRAFGENAPLFEITPPNQPITDQSAVKNYVNFYEFGSHKQVAPLAQKMSVNPWTLSIEGLVNNPKVWDLEAIQKQMPIEERIMQHRCVEAWAFVAPWRGFSLRHLLTLADPKLEAKYVRFTTLSDKKSMPGLDQFWYPWPYTEGLTIDEAMHELAFIATGLYGEELPKQNGAPLRLVLPWKYGFKSIKSIVKIELIAERPVSFWEEIQANEYGFWANVNPNISHPRWSQATHRMLGTDERVETKIYNGYERWVSNLYPDVGSHQREYFF